MAGHAPVKPTKKQIQDAETLWDQFMQISKWFIVGICVILIIMMFMFVPFA